MKKLYTISFALAFIVANAFSQSKNPADYKTNATGFYENKGQIVDQNYKPNPAVKYLFNGKGLNVQLRGTGFSYDTYTDTPDKTDASTQSPFRGLEQDKFQQPTPFTRHYHRIDIELIGCNTAAPMLAENKSESYFNYFTAGTPQGGVSDVHTYQKVTYKNIYPNIDLQFFCNEKNAVEYNFIVHPGGDYKQIKLQYKGADGISLQNGAIVMETSNGKLSENIPSSYLLDRHSLGDGGTDTKQPVQVNYAAFGNGTFGFSVPRSSLSALNTDLIIDPTPCLSWGTYYGGTGSDYSQAIALDASNNVYITGGAASASAIATAGAYQTSLSGTKDAYVAKLDATGASLVWGTYYGGTGSEVGYAITLDASNNIYIIGAGSSTSGIATPGAYQTTYGGGTYDVFVAKFNSAGSSLLWGTYYGGSNADYGIGIALDAGNNVYITGYTASTSGINTAGAYQTIYGGGAEDVFVAEFNSAGSSLLWGTYYGGTGTETATSITLDAGNNVYITGTTASSTGIATAGAYQTTYLGGDAFVAKFNSTGSSLVWGTYYGGTNTDISEAITLDAGNNVYIAGYTYSVSGIATAGVYKTVYTGGANGNTFIAKFNSSGTSLLLGTYYGGTAGDAGFGIALDASGSIYIVGNSGSTSSIATAGAYQTTMAGTFDAFVAKFNSTLTSLTWGTYYGGSGGEWPYGIKLDISGNVFITGSTVSTSGIATAGAYQTAFGGIQDAFVAKFGCNPIPLNTSSSQTNVNCFGSCNGTATVNPSGGTSPYTYSWAPSGGTNATATGLCAGSYTCTVTDATAATTTVSVTITQPTQLRDSITATTNILCNGGNNGSATVGVKGGTTGYTYSWSPSGGTNATASNLTASSYTVTVTDNNGCSVTTKATITQPALLTTSTTVNSNVLCNGGNTGKITANPSGGTGAYTYNWTPSGGTNPIASNLTAGSYTITVTDGNGCSATASATITQPPVLTVTTGAPSNVKCNGGNNGSTSAIASGGTMGYTYSWSNGQTTSNATSLTAGTYTVNVTDGNGCTATATSTITQPTALNGVPNANPNSICKGDCSVISVTESGGTPAYTYSWNIGGTTSSLTVCPTTATVYSVTTTDANGCTTVTVVTVNVNPLPTVTMSAAKDTACINWTTDALTGNPSGGTFTGAGVSGTNFDPNTAGAGMHKIVYTYTDVNGCTNKDSVNITVSSCTGVQEVNSLDSQIKFYPNPFSQSVMLI